MTPASTRFPLRKSPRRLAQKRCDMARSRVIACAATSASWRRAAHTGWAFVMPRLPQASRALLRASAISPQAAVTVTGETRDYAGRFFCPGCGSSVSALTADEIGVSLGPSMPRPADSTYKLWTVRRESSLPALPLTVHNRNASTRGVARHHRAGAVVRAQEPGVHPCRLCDSRLARPSHFVRCETTNLARFLKNSF